MKHRRLLVEAGATLRRLMPDFRRKRGGQAYVAQSGHRASFPCYKGSIRLYLRRFDFTSDGAKKDPRIVDHGTTLPEKAPITRHRRPAGRPGRAAAPPLASSSAVPDGRRLSVPVLMSLLFGVLSLPPKRDYLRSGRPRTSQQATMHPALQTTCAIIAFERRRGCLQTPPVAQKGHFRPVCPRCSVAPYPHSTGLPRALHQA